MHSYIRSRTDRRRIETERLGKIGCSNQDKHQRLPPFLTNLKLLHKIHLMGPPLSLTGTARDEHTHAHRRTHTLTCVRALAHTTQRKTTRHCHAVNACPPSATEYRYVTASYFPPQICDYGLLNTVAHNDVFPPSVVRHRTAVDSSNAQ